MMSLSLAMILCGSALETISVPAEESAVSWEDYAPCGLVSLYAVCRTKEMSVNWEDVKRLVGSPGRGGELSFAALAAAASQLGMHPVGLEVGREKLIDLPMPAIVQVHDRRYPDELPHFLVLMRPDVHGVWLLDAPVWASLLLVEQMFTCLISGETRGFTVRRTVQVQLSG